MSFRIRKLTLPTAMCLSPHLHSRSGFPYRHLLHLIGGDPYQEGAAEEASNSDLASGEIVDPFGLPSDFPGSSGAP